MTCASHSFYHPDCAECVETTSWQQTTPTQSEPAASFSRGISELEEARKVIHVQHYRVAGICSNLLISSPLSTGTEILEQQHEIVASSVKLLTALEDLQRFVENVRDRLQ